MKMTIRHGVFETNSSSVHSLTVADLDQYYLWKNKKLLTPKYSTFYRNLENDKHVEVPLFATREEYAKILAEIGILTSKKYFLENFNTYKQYLEGCQNYETFSHEHTTKSGDKIVVFGYHGNNW
jgi:hypothetical protein